MNRETREKRLQLLSEVSRLEEKCIGCETHAELNTKKNVTAMTNACKACPIGMDIGLYGEKLMGLVGQRKKYNEY